MSVLCPDGKTLLVAGSTGQLNGPWGFKLRLRQPAGLAVLCTGSVGSFEATERHTGRLGQSVRREVRYRHRALVSHEDAANAITTFLWLGAYHELSWTTGGCDVSFDMFAAVLATIDLDDSPDVLTVTAKRGTGGELSMSVAANSIADICAITVLPIRDPSVLVPAHPGRTVPGGIMWRSDEVGADGGVRRTAAIANTTTLTYLGFFAPDAPQNVTLVESLRVTLN